MNIELNEQIQPLERTPLDLGDFSPKLWKIIRKLDIKFLEDFSQKNELDFYLDAKADNKDLGELGSYLESKKAYLKLTSAQEELLQECSTRSYSFTKNTARKYTGYLSFENIKLTLLDDLHKKYFKTISQLEKFRKLLEKSIQKDGGTSGFSF